MRPKARWASVVVLISLAGCRQEQSNSSPGALDRLYGQSLALIRVGELEQARQQFQAGLDQSRLPSDRSRFAAGLGIVEQSFMRFRPALAWLRQALADARAAGNRDAAASILGTIAVVYSRLGDIENSSRAIEEALAANPSQPKRLALLLNRAIGLGKSGRSADAEKAFREITALSRGGELEGRALENLGYQLLRNGKLKEAETTLRQCLSLRARNADPDLPDTYYVMAWLRFRQNQFRDALEMVDRYLTAPGRHYWIGHVLHLRGKILESIGDSGAALASYRDAIGAVRRSRRQVIPTEHFQATSEARTADIFDSFVQLAARQSSPRLWREALAVAAEARAAAHRAAVFSPDEWSSRLPGSYWSALARAEALEVRGNSRTYAEDGELARLRLHLVDEESRLAAGLTVPAEKNARDPRALVAENEAAFVYHLGRDRSLLWIVTRNTLEVKHLPGEAVINQKVAAFRRAVLEGDTRQWGRSEPRIFPGEFSGAQTTIYYWTIVPDGSLFDLPFAALPGSRPGTMLIDQHALSFAPTLAPFGPAPSSFSRRAVVLADPVYNRADARFQPGPRFQLASFQLNRLPGASGEATRVSEAWRAAGWSTGVHVGGDATRDRLFRVMDERPAILHLATHVVPAPDESSAPRLALSLDPDGQSPQTVSPRDLSSRRQAPGVVIMSGCDSGGGPVWPAAGLMGLTRGWLLSGASAVVATFWPVPDDSGEFVELVHRRLAAVQKGLTVQNDARELRRATAHALREAAIEARDGGRIPPVTWAAYFSMGRN